ncbi:polysaccharide biosynthesis tyrosine autokinase [Psychrobacter sp. TAE2020]|uniref:polysaccharide biosynthesis tyrosine autokinase n=1 Tax=Psychrobacter sp. TAE2020 TaxID=2846762 RepID=UPI001C1241D1|nr:polysaccharide biosynthesis tyrosine autokinase [Psychrobacter sp. TAE2020]MBU5618057.1 polysaccharide biosynthesis tyrosine autokinase [Psychrobacter sp. TAE2020]
MNTDSKSLSKPIEQKDEDEIDLLALLFALLRGWKTILFFALVGLLIGVLYSRYVNPTFKSNALIQIDDKSGGLPALGENISDLLGSEESKAQTEAELIKSRMVLQPVVDLLHLGIRLSDPEVDALTRIKNNRTDTQVNIPEGVALATADGNVQVSNFEVPQSNLNQSFTLIRSESGTGFVLSSGFDDYKGQLGQAHQFKSVDGIIEITVNNLPDNGHTVNITKQSLQTTTDSINSALSVVEKGKQTGVIEMSLTGANQQQVSLILKEIILSYIGQNQSRGSEETTKTIEFMESQIPVLKQKLEAAEKIFNDFRKQYGTIDVGKEAELLLTENSQIDAQLNELKLKKADLTTYYTEEHPLVIQINDQLRVLNNRKQEIDNKITGLPEVQREFLKLSQDTEINREIYLTLLKNYQQLQIAKAGQIGFARIIDLPINTYKAIAPKKLQIIILAMLLGAMLGTMLVLLKNLLRNVVKDPERLEAKTGIPVIATIPRSPLLTRLGKSKKSQNRLLAYADNNSLSYEAIKSLRTSLMFGMTTTSDSAQRAKVILITGESPGVGKSFISSNLSEVFAQLDKKVLIIDADMRLGELHKMFNMTQDNGLGDYLAQDVAITTVVHPTIMDNVDFMPRGQHPHNPASLLSGDKFTTMMTELNAHYDYIILDSPPILAASDAIIMSQYADKVLMVTRYDKSIEGQVVYAIKQMHKANVQVDGIILNDVQQGLMSKYSYHYSYAYGNNN